MNKWVFNRVLNDASDVEIRTLASGLFHSSGAAAWKEQLSPNRFFCRSYFLLFIDLDTESSTAETDKMVLVHAHTCMPAPVFCK